MERIILGCTLEGSLRFVTSSVLYSYYLCCLMKISLWNCRGAGNDVFLRKIKQYVRNHDPGVVVLVETRVSSIRADVVLNRISFSKVARVDARGFSGGIWFFWREDMVDIEILLML